LLGIHKAGNTSVDSSGAEEAIADRNGTAVMCSEIIKLGGMKRKCRVRRRIFAVRTSEWLEVVQL
jgi:hypothetical protein